MMSRELIVALEHDYKYAHHQYLNRYKLGFNILQHEAFYFEVNNLWFINNTWSFHISQINKNIIQNG